MPNSLAHIGGQGVVSRRLLPSVDGRWILLAAMLPDLPWILQRMAGRLGSWDLLDVRAYCGALAILAGRPAGALTAMSLGVVLHLLLDACQIKWGGGVHLLAPWSWQVLSLVFFWPESWITVALMLLGLAVVVLEWRRPTAGPLLAIRPGRVAVALALGLAYILLPLAIMGGAEASDTHLLATLRHAELRPGRDVALDRVPVSVQNGPMVRLFTGERLRLTGNVPRTAGRYSLRGRFLDAGTIQVEGLHRHLPAWRDLANYLGLLLIAVAWLRPRARRPA